MNLQPPAPSRDDGAPPVVSPPAGNPRFELLDGLRAIAALSVVGLHVSVYTRYFPGWQGAYIRQLSAGVTIFFLLSGFLLYRPFVAARVTGLNRIRFRDYARRRVLRIVPAYWLALTVLALWPGLPGSPLGGIPARVLSTRLLAWLGIVSYGIYLWHLPLVPKVGGATSDVLALGTSGLPFTVLLYLLVASVAVACAATSYYLVERPILRFKNGLRRPTTEGRR